MNCSELFVSALENEGVTQIFGVPEEENLAMVEALRRSSIKLVVTRHEQAAAFMARALSPVDPGSTWALQRSPSTTMSMTRSTALI